MLALLMRDVFRRAVLAGAGVFFTLSAVEFLIVCLDVAPRRPAPLLLLNPTRDAEMREDAGAFRFDARWLWEPRPRAVIEGEPINEDGYRGPAAAPAPTGLLRIATLGDSSTFGLGVREAEAWPRRLEQALGDRGVAAEVLNFGVIGFTAVQGASYYAGRVRGYRPDVVIAAFGAVNEQVTAPGGNTDASRIVRLRTPAHRVRAALDRFATFRWLDGLLSAGKAPPEPPPSTDDWKRRVPLADFEVALRQLATLVREDGAQLVLVSPPRRRDTEVTAPLTRLYSEALARIAQGLGLPLVDVRAAVRREEEVDGAAAGDGAGSPWFVDGWHPSPAGHQRYADEVADALVRLELDRVRRPR